MASCVVRSVPVISLAVLVSATSCAGGFNVCVDLACWAVRDRGLEVRVVLGDVGYDVDSAVDAHGAGAHNQVVAAGVGPLAASVFPVVVGTAAVHLFNLLACLGGPQVQLGCYALEGIVLAAGHKHTQHVPAVA